MKIFDCFAFFNELDVLELRLRELWDVVDHFVLVEATRTFQKKDKPLYFQMNQKRFEPYLSKIIHVVVDEYPTFWTKLRPVKTWDYDSGQKEGILKGLDKAGPDDLIIVSDLDEIPLAKKVLEFKDKPGIRVFEQYQSYYYLNYICKHIYDYGGKAVAQRNRDGYGRWRGSVMLEKKLIKDIKTTRNYRDEEGPHIHLIKDGGWHYSYMGGFEMIIHKMQSWAHTEYNNEKFRSHKIIVENVLHGRDPLGEGAKYELIDIDASGLPFLNDVLKNRAHWSHMIRTKDQLLRETSAALESAPAPTR